MFDYKESWKIKIADVLTELHKKAGLDTVVNTAALVAEIPPDPNMGDLGFPMFAFAKTLRMGPPQIAKIVEEELLNSGLKDISAAGPYLNVRVNRGEAACGVLGEFLGRDKDVQSSGAGDIVIDRSDILKGQRIMVEYSSPNTNKPLHLGHLRNDVLGESSSRILEACGAEVRRVCIINDRGIHICKSMIAYMEHGNGKTPESEGIKSDHFVGDWYVRFSRDLKSETDELEKKGLNKKEAENQAPNMQKAKELLIKWEAGNEETVALWKKMNSWAIEGMKETYLRTGIRFDQYYYESQTYLLGKDEILKGLDRGVFFREEDGSVQADLTGEKLDKKVLLRKDGTSIYITQDIGTAIHRHKDWPFNRLIYVVGSEQNYHFKVLFVLLQKLGLNWASNLYHLSYGMVNLPDGRMKSREGTVVDADLLIDNLRDMALEEIRNKEREEAVGDPEQAAEKIALGAIHYYLLQVSPVKDMIFDPKESLSFNGNTGPYLQYMGARISSLLEKSGEKEIGDKGMTLEKSSHKLELLTNDAEWELIKTLANYRDAVEAAASAIDPSLITSFLYELAKNFSRFYHDCPILSAENPDLCSARLYLCKIVHAVLKDALYLTCIPFMDTM